jgi:phosphatidylethanolamine-binding protein (PEBP) family uncharacterized protein
MLPRQAGEAGGALLPVGAKQALPDGDAPQARYYGPCPDAGDPAHHYVITVYALSVDRLDVSAAATPAAVDYMVESKSLGKASIVRSFGRPASDQK